MRRPSICIHIDNAFAPVRDIFRVMRSKTAAIRHDPTAHSQSAPPEAFRSQILLSGSGPWLFPSDINPKGYQQSFRKVWATTLQQGRRCLFSPVRLAFDVCQPAFLWRRLLTNGSPSFLRQGDSNVFKKYSQMKPMKREALEKLDRMACERSGLQQVGLTDGFWYSFATVGSRERISKVKALWEVFYNQSTRSGG